jgi:hypothetical protein
MGEETCSGGDGIGFTGALQSRVYALRHSSADYNP